MLPIPYSQHLNHIGSVKDDLNINQHGSNYVKISQLMPPLTPSAVDCHGDNDHQFTGEAKQFAHLHDSKHKPEQKRDFSTGISRTAQLRHVKQ